MASRFPVDSVGELGILLDDGPLYKPAHAWQVAHNVRSQDGGMTLCGGWRKVRGTLPVQPLIAFPVITAAEVLTLIGGKQYVYLLSSGGVWSNVTRQTASPAMDIPYNTDVELGWHGGCFNSVPVLTNNYDVPQALIPVSYTAKLRDLPNWPSTHRAKFIVGFKNYLIALDVTKSGTRYPHLVLWSHPSDPGGVPISWDITDPTKDCGEFPLGESASAIMDVQLMRDQLLIYKQDQIWAMQWVGGVNIFRFVKLFDGIGALNKGCAVSFGPKGTQHFVVGPQDVFIHDGVTATPVLNGRARRQLYQDMNPLKTSYYFCAVQHDLEEVWFCYASGTSDVVNKALTWNWRTQAVLTRDIPDCCAMTHVQTVESSKPIRTFDDLTEAWDDSFWFWNQEMGRITFPLVALSYGDQAMYEMDAGFQQNGKDYTSVLERNVILAGQQNRDGTYRIDTVNSKLLLAIYPLIEAPADYTFRIGVGVTDTPFEAPQYEWHTFNVGTDLKIDTLLAGNHMHVRFEFKGAAAKIRFYGYEVEWTPNGEIVNV